MYRNSSTWKIIIKAIIIISVHLSDSPNSFQSAKQAKIKLQDLCSHALMTVDGEEEKSVGTKKKNTPKWHCADVAQEK